MNEKPKRRWYQFSLGTLLAGLTICATSLGLCLFCIRPAERQRAAVKIIETLPNGLVTYADPPADELWLISQLRKRLPRDYFDPVIGVQIVYGSATDTDLLSLRGLNQLETLELYNNPDVSDAGIANIVGMTRLKSLSLRYTNVSDSGMVHISRLAHLQELDLQGTKVTDIGVARLRCLEHLQLLRLTETHTTGVGTAEFQKELPHCEIYYR